MSPPCDSNIFSFLVTVPAEERHAGESVLFFFREAGIQRILN